MRCKVHVISSWTPLQYAELRISSYHLISGIWCRWLIAEWKMNKERGLHIMSLVCFKKSSFLVGNEQRITVAMYCRSYWVAETKSSRTLCFPLLPPTTFCGRNSCRRNQGFHIAFIFFLSKNWILSSKESRIASQALAEFLFRGCSILLANVTYLHNPARKFFVELYIHELRVTNSIFFNKADWLVQMCISWYTPLRFSLLFLSGIRFYKFELSNQSRLLIINKCG